MWKCNYCGNEVGITEKQDKFHKLNNSGKIQKSFKKLSILWAIECPECGVLTYLDDNMSGKKIEIENISGFCYKEGYYEKNT